MSFARSWRKRLKENRSSLDSLKSSVAAENPYLRYRLDPNGFARHVLGAQWTTKQIEIAESLLTPPYRTLVSSANDVGKTHLAGGLCLWWFLTRVPSIVLTTAPKREQVVNLLWKEIRRQSEMARLPIPFDGPKLPQATRGGEWDMMLGTTATTGTRFQGYHESEIFFLLEEAVGVDEVIWRALETMFSPPGHAILAIFNPTDTASAAYRAQQLRGQDGLPLWRTITMSALDHPNILAELSGLPPPIPSAIRLGRLTERLHELCEPVTGIPLSTDIAWPPRRPCPLCQGSPT